MPPPAHDTSSSDHSSTYTREQKPSTTLPDNAARSEDQTDDLSDALSYREGPPPLGYTFRTIQKERYIAVFFTLLFVETCILPLILFYSLQWGAHLSTTKNLAIITSLVGTVSGLKVTQRTWQLLFKSGHNSRRPIGAGRWGLDTTHILISVALGAFFIPLIIGSSLTPASVPTVAMALPCLMLVFCIPFLISGIWDRQIRLPIRVSSLPPREPLPPLTYTIVEDVVAVDGGGGLEFRQAWRHRYESSRVMRHLLRILSIWWGITGVIVASGCIVAAWTAPNNTGYGLGYGIPWLWAIVAAISTWVYIKKQLRLEMADWEEAHVHKTVSLHLREKEVDREADRRHAAFVRTQSRPSTSARPSAAGRPSTVKRPSTGSRPSTATRPDGDDVEGGVADGGADARAEKAALGAASDSAPSYGEATRVDPPHDESISQV
ncbi:hypothetical protein EIP86_006101 [Pleurotus ostreatoroseus]|nr:hypothetical protein EIP86_006101 [Pleurotus ostreatoroseus]